MNIATNIGENMTDKKEKDRIRSLLEKHFSDRTNLFPPKGKENSRSTGIRWWKPLREIAELANWDEHDAVWLINQSLIRLRGATIKAPQSIVNTARTIINEKRLENEGFYNHEHDDDESEWTPQGGCR